MNRDLGQSPRAPELYPLVSPFDQRFLDVGGGHHVYVEQSGNPDGLPVVVVHGGPGGGTSPMMRRFFDPQVYRVVMFDQRGCGRSRPTAQIQDNTTWDLVADMERIRSALGIDTWALFGGSWGATLALIYAQSHPERVQALVLRGIFLMTAPELEWFYGGGVARFWPEAWERFAGAVPLEEQDNLIAAYHRRLFCGDLATEIRYARIWTAWENALASLESDGTFLEIPADYARAFARLECHYFYNNGFLTPETAILARMQRIAHIPGYIVQGRYDMICPPKTAYDLHQRWPVSKMRMVTRAGHALSERGIALELVRIMDQLGAAL